MFNSWQGYPVGPYYAPPTNQLGPYGQPPAGQFGYWPGQGVQPYYAAPMPAQPGSSGPAPPLPAEPPPPLPAQEHQPPPPAQPQPPPPCETEVQSQPPPPPSDAGQVTSSEKPTQPSTHDGSSRNEASIAAVESEERDFLHQYDQWKKEYAKWKDDNKDHPDKEAYNQYEDQWRGYEVQMEQKLGEIRRRKSQLLEGPDSSVTVSAIQAPSTGASMPHYATPSRVAPRLSMSGQQPSAQPIHPQPSMSFQAPPPPPPEREATGSDLVEEQQKPELKESEGHTSDASHGNVEQFPEGQGTPSKQLWDVNMQQGLADQATYSEVDNYQFAGQHTSAYPEHDYFSGRGQGSSAHGPFGQRDHGSLGDRGPGSFSDRGRGSFGSRSRGSFGDHGRASFGDQGAESFGDQGPESFGDQGPESFGDQGHGSFGDQGHGSFGDQGRGSFGDQGHGPFGSRGRPLSGDRGRGSFGDRGGGPFGDQGRGSFCSRSRGTFGDRGQRHFADPCPESFGDKGRGSFGDHGQGSFGDRARGSLGGHGRGSFGDRGRGSFGDRGRGSFGDRGRGSFGDRGRGFFGDRGRGSFGERGRGSFGDHGRGSFGDGGHGSDIIAERGFGDHGQGAFGSKSFSQGFKAEASRELAKESDFGSSEWQTGGETDPGEERAPVRAARASGFGVGHDRGASSGHDTPRGPGRGFGANAQALSGEEPGGNEWSGEAGFGSPFSGDGKTQRDQDFRRKEHWQQEESGRGRGQFSRGGRRPMQRGRGSAMFSPRGRGRPGGFGSQPQMEDNEQYYPGDRASQPFREPRWDKEDGQGQHARGFQPSAPVRPLMEVPFGRAKGFGDSTSSRDHAEGFSNEGHQEQSSDSRQVTEKEAKVEEESSNGEITQWGFLKAEVPRNLGPVDMEQRLGRRARKRQSRFENAEAQEMDSSRGKAISTASQRRGGGPTPLMSLSPRGSGHTRGAPMGRGRGVNLGKETFGSSVWDPSRQVGDHSMGFGGQGRGQNQNLRGRDHNQGRGAQDFGFGGQRGQFGSRGDRSDSSLETRDCFRGNEGDCHEDKIDASVADPLNVSLQFGPDGGLIVPQSISKKTGHQTSEPSNASGSRWDQAKTTPSRGGSSKWDMKNQPDEKASSSEQEKDQTETTGKLGTLSSIFSDHQFDIIKKAADELRRLKGNAAGPTDTSDTTTPATSSASHQSQSSERSREDTYSHPSKQPTFRILEEHFDDQSRPSRSSSGHSFSGASTAEQRALPHAASCHDGDRKRWSNAPPGQWSEHRSRWDESAGVHGDVDFRASTADHTPEELFGLQRRYDSIDHAHPPQRNDPLDTSGTSPFDLPGSVIDYAHGSGFRQNSTFPMDVDMRGPHPPQPPWLQEQHGASPKRSRFDSPHVSSGAGTPPLHPGMTSNLSAHPPGLSPAQSLDNLLQAAAADGQRLLPAMERVNITDLLENPGRAKRPANIVIILRGLPGAGKSFLCKLIRDRELASGGEAPRIFCLDDYFQVEVEKTVKDDNGRVTRKKVIDYEWEPDLEGTYRLNLLKSFKKTIDSGFFSFIIVDAVNDKVQHFEEFWSYAKSKGFQVYVGEIKADPTVCEKRDTHKRGLQELRKLEEGWEKTPPHLLQLDLRSLLQDAAIEEVQMEESEVGPNAAEETDEEDDEEETNGEATKCRWDIEPSETKLDKLDGLIHRQRRMIRSPSPQDIAEFLHSHRFSPPPQPGKKRVRWADIEELRDQERHRNVGFILGQTNWEKITGDDNTAFQALNRTKYI